MAELLHCTPSMSGLAKVGKGGERWGKVVSRKAVRPAKTADKTTTIAPILSKVRFF